MWILPVIAAVVTAQPKPVPAASQNPLPQAIRQTLNEEYPGWKLAPVSPAVKNAFTKIKTTRLPSMTVGDFNRDSYWDYVVQIAISNTGVEEQVVIAFFAKTSGYEENILQSMGPDPNTYLWVHNKDTLMILGSPAGNTIYKLEEGKFQESVDRVDPDQTDPTIPRPPPEIQ